MTARALAAVPATLEGLVDPHVNKTARMLIATVITRPELLFIVPQLETDDFPGIYEQWTWLPIRNLQARGETITVQSLEAEHARMDRLGDTNRRLTVGREYLGELVKDASLAPDEAVKRMLPGWATALRKLREKKEAAIAAEDERLRGEDEIDDIAMRDAEPVSAVPIAPTRVEAYGLPFLEFVGEVEPDDNPADVFEADGLIVRGEPSLVIGDPKVGKTMTVEDLVLHIAAGRKSWCGVPIYRQCRVLLFLREDSKRTSVRRLWQLARGAGIRHQELEGFLTIDSESPLYFDDPKLTAKLERQLGDHDICVIDSLSTIHNADENSVERMAPVMNRWRDMALQTKTALPLVHHFRKRGESSVGSGGNVLQRARGSSLIAATTRHAVGIERGPNDHEIVLSVESNHEVSTEPFVVRRRFGVDAFGRKFITHERVGTMRQALEADAIGKIDPVVLAVIKGVSIEGIGARDLRIAVNERLRERDGKGVRPHRVDAAARRLEEGGKIGKTELDKWQIRACPEGGSR